MKSVLNSSEVSAGRNLADSIKAIVAVLIVQHREYVFTYLLFASLALLSYTYFGLLKFSLGFREIQDYTLAVAILSAVVVIWTSRSKLLKIAKSSKATVETKGLKDRKNRYYLFGLIAIVALAFVLRIWNLTILDPYTDEYAHLIAAKDLLDVGAIEYTRAKLVTYLVALFYQIGNASSFYEYLFWGRIPSVIFGALTTVPIYFLAKKISRPIGIISALLWATSPWAIGVARTIREYAFYPFFVLVAVLATIKLVEVLFSYTQRPKQKTITYSVVLASIPAGILTYAFLLDTLSTLKVSVVILLATVVSLILLHAKDIRALGNKHNISISTIVVSGLSLALIVAILYASTSSQISLTSVSISRIWADRMFFDSFSSPMHWWGQYSPAAYISVLFLAISTLYAFVTKRREYLLHFIVFVSLLVFFVIFFDRYVRPRYIFYALPFFTILISMGVYGLYSLIKTVKPRFVKISLSMVLGIFFLQTFNYQAITYHINSERHGYIATTNEYHDRVSNLIEFLSEEIEEGDVFIVTITEGVLKLEFNKEEDKVHKYRYTDSERFNKVREFMEVNPKGLMILDSRSNGHWVKGYPREGEFMVGDVVVRIMLDKNGLQVYRWDK